ncbi:ribosome biogenesis protein NOP53 [Scleropages formosus]|uniref:Ribosome biogenesis protein NOP53 n=1 Tax=Scleropages formosus TaxID=113540 RepID=A0A8C9R8K8_SCLFO|nr:ribosome biogenesis protein NOP53 [Scleropages formosus]
MAAARRNKRVAASQPGFLRFDQRREQSEPSVSKRKRVNKNKKKNWNKYSNVQDVEDFLEDVRLQERATGGLVSEKPNDSLFFVDTGDQQEEIPEKDVQKKKRASWPLRVDLILQHDSLVPPPKDILAHQKPNAKKLRRKSEMTKKLGTKGKLIQKQKVLKKRKAVAVTSSNEQILPNNDPKQPFYDLWSQQEKQTSDPWFLEQTKKKLVKRPDRLNEKPSALPAVEVIAPGGSYNPDFFDHQALLLQAHTVEEKRQKEEQKLERQLAVKQEDIATEETVFQEQVEGLLEEDEMEEPTEEGMAKENTSAYQTATQKKTERQRKKEKAEKQKEKQKRVQRELVGRRQQLFQLRSIQADLRKRDLTAKQRQAQRRAKKEAQKFQPRRLGRLKFQTPDLEVQLSDELSGSLRTLKPEGSILKDRFKSLQKRNLIEPRERAKFKRKYKLKYVEKRAFKAIT